MSSLCRMTGGGCAVCAGCAGWVPLPQEELSVPGVAGGIGPTGFPGTACPVSLICFIGEEPALVFLGCCLSSFGCVSKWAWKVGDSHWAAVGVLHVLALSKSENTAFSRSQAFTSND